MSGFGDLIKGVGEILTGIMDITNGVIKEAETGPTGLFYFGMDAFVILQYTAVFLATNFICGLKMLTNLTSCFMYYMVDVFAAILYLPVTILVFVLSLVSIPSYAIEKQFWDGMEWLDGKVYASIKFHIIHYPKSVRDKCYNCKRLKLTAYAKKISEFMNDIEDPIFELLFSGIVQSAKGVMELFQGLMDLLGGLMNIF